MCLLAALALVLALATPAVAQDMFTWLCIDGCANAQKFGIVHAATGQGRTIDMVSTFTYNETATAYTAVDFHKCLTQGAGDPLAVYCLDVHAINTNTSGLGSYVALVGQQDTETPADSILGVDAVAVARHVSGAVGRMTGARSIVAIATGGTVGNVFSHDVSLSLQAGHVDEWQGLSILAQVMGTATLERAYGIVVNVPEGPTTRYALYTFGDAPTRLGSLAGVGTRAVCATADGNLVVCP